jgi:hypothetical protein
VVRASRLAACLTTLLVVATGAGAAPPFARPLRVALPKDFGAVSVAAADLDGDGRVDLAVTGRTGVCVLLGDGRGGFRPCAPVVAGANPTAIVVADLNGDGREDLVVANHETDYVTLLVNAGAGRFTTRPLHLRSFPHPHAVAAGDFDRDGKPDLAVDSWGEDRVTLLFGKDDWHGPGTSLPIGTNPYHTLTAADVDGDGNVDLVAPNWGKGTVSVLLGDGRGHFAHAPGSPFRAGPTPFAAAVADVDGDGRPDILVANYSGHADATADDGLTWIRNDGNRRFTPFPIRVARGDYSASVAAGDVNGDGIADVALPNTNGASVTLLFGSRDGPRGGETVATMPAPYAIALADLNGDGRADLVVASQKSDEILVFLAAAGPPRATPHARRP